MAVFQTIWALVAVILLGSGSSTVHAADIRASNDELCLFKLQGEIIPGDYDRFANLIAHSHPDSLDERTRTICLKSPGGSYNEALKVSELIYKSGISTLIEDGFACFSACAIIFMAGVLPDRQIPHRKLSAGGVLGFHAPYLSATEGKYSKEEMESAAQGMCANRRNPRS